MTMMYHSEPTEPLRVLQPMLKQKQDSLGVKIVPVTKREHADRLVAYLRDKRPLCAWDTETIGCNVSEESPVGKAICVSFSLCFDSKVSYYVPCYGDYIFLLQCFAPWLEDEACPKTGHNIRYDMHVAANHGITVRGVTLDTQVADWLHDENAYSFTLEECVKREFAEKYADYSNTFTYWGTTKAKANRHKKPCRIRDLSERINPRSLHYEPGKLMLYGAKDAWIEYRLAVREIEKLKGKRWGKSTLHDYYNKFEAPYLQAIFAMERRGITVDVEHMHGLDTDWQRDIEGLEKEFIQKCIDDGAKQKDLVGLNLHSTKQLTHLFFNVLKLPPGKRTNNGAYKLDKGEVKRLAEEGHTVVLPFERWRSLMKLRGTYAVPLQRVDKHSRVYTSFKQHGTVTGRLCVAKGTLVTLAGGKLAPIESVTAGAMAYTYDFAKHQLTLRPVVWAGKTGCKKVVRVYWESEEDARLGYLDLTPEHKVRLTEGQYVPASGLSPNDRVLAMGPRMVRSHRVLSVVRLEQLVDVYDLEVEETHNFIANELCVHNSSDHPNLMNIPTRSKEGERLREGFTARKGMVLICSDLSQIELRILAHYAQDERMIAGFNSHEDFHALAARDMFPELKGMSAAEIKEKHPKLRGASKEVSFGVNYGMGADSLAKKLKVSKEMAAEYMAKLDRTFPGIGKFRRATMMFAKQHGYIQTYTMRYRNCPDMHDREQWKRMLAERQAFNSKIQGSAADIIKMAMILLHEDEEMSELNAHLLLQVHDELVLEAPEKHAERVKDIVVHYMQEPYQYFGLKPLRVPTIAEAGIGKNWLEAKK
jgi:DNA polymerase I-like protein with 3'-5' exonuclease and polymerase domains